MRSFVETVAQMAHLATKKIEAFYLSHNQEYSADFQVFVPSTVAIGCLDKKAKGDIQDIISNTDWLLSKANARCCDRFIPEHLSTRQGHNVP